jgi:hypothetical protein
MDPPGLMVGNALVGFSATLDSPAELAPAAELAAPAAADAVPAELDRSNGDPKNAELDDDAPE